MVELTFVATDLLGTTHHAGLTSPCILLISREFLIINESGGGSGLAALAHEILLLKLSLGRPPLIHVHGLIVVLIHTCLLVVIELGLLTIVTENEPKIKSRSASYYVQSISRILKPRSLTDSKTKNYLRIQVFVEIFAIRWLLVLIPLILLFVQHLVSSIVRVVAMRHLDVTAETLRAIVLILLIIRVAASASLRLTAKRQDNFVVRPSMLRAPSLLLRALLKSKKGKHTYLAKRRFSSCLRLELNYSKPRFLLLFMLMFISL